MHAFLLVFVNVLCNLHHEHEYDNNREITCECVNTSVCIRLSIEPIGLHVFINDMIRLSKSVSVSRSHSL